MGLFYQEDLVCLATDRNHLGTIEVTHSDVSSHSPDPVSEYQAAIKKGKGITQEAFKAFLRTGVPPKGTALVEWIHLPWQHKPEPLLIRESELKLVDRAHRAGDVVKKDLASHMSGTVTSTSSFVSLVQPAAWPIATSSATPRDPDDFVHNYMSEPEQMIQVSTQDLKLASDYEPGQYIMYQQWVGRVIECWEDVYVRLSNGSVVVVEDPEELETYREDELSVVGDFVRCKKANLRRGRWIYGSYDPECV
jgi:ubiquitin-conjugating enzyme E2 O